MSISTIGAVVKLRTGVTSSEFSDDAINGFVSHAISRVSSDLTADTITSGSAQEALAILYAMADIAYARASNASLRYRIQSDRGEIYQNQITENNMKLAEALREEINALRSKIDGDEDIFVGELIRTNRFGQQVPYDFQDAPTAVTLTTTVDGSNVELVWTESSAEDFAEYIVWRDTVEDMIDYNTYTADSATNFGFVATSEDIKHVPTRWKTYYEDLSLTAGTYYYVIETVDRSGRRAISSVVSATVS